MDPPISNRPTVTAWLQHVLQFATCRLGALPDAPLTPADYAACGLGYAHSLGKRGPSRESYCSTVWTPVGGREPTPWARALMSALEEAGMSFTAECEVDRGEGKKPYSIDVAFPEYRLAVEVDGRLRGLDIRDHVSDSRRTAFLLTRGWIVHRVPNARLNRPDDVDAVVNEIRQIIESINTNKSAKETHAP
jgi:very-short-patch-repair endonuclease